MSLDNIEELEVSPEHVERAFNRARRVLILATLRGMPAPSVELFSDGSAVFNFPRTLADELGALGKVGAIMKLIGSTRVMPRSLHSKDVTIHVCQTLGREHD